MDSLRDAIEAIEARRKRLDVYTDSDEIAAEFETQFSTRNVRVDRRPFPATDRPGFVIVRDDDGNFRGAIGIDRLESMLSPEIHPPWELDAAIDTAAIFSFLDNTIFTAYDRRRLLAVTREIEERAWRTGVGHLLVGFQRADALEAQADVYGRLAEETDLAVRLFLDDEWTTELSPSIDVVAEADEELGAFWFVLFDGGDGALNASGLVAEERDAGRYYGFWTNDPDWVDRLSSSLESRFGGP